MQKCKTDIKKTKYFSQLKPSTYGIEENERIHPKQYKTKSINREAIIGIIHSSALILLRQHFNWANYWSQEIDIWTQVRTLRSFPLSLQRGSNTNSSSPRDKNNRVNVSALWQDESIRYPNLYPEQLFHLFVCHKCNSYRWDNLKNNSSLVSC